MPMTELSRMKILQGRRESEKSVSLTPAPEPEKKSTKKKETSIFVPEDEVDNVSEAELGEVTE